MFSVILAAGQPNVSHHEGHIPRFFNNFKELKYNWNVIRVVIFRLIDAILDFKYSPFAAP